MSKVDRNQPLGTPTWVDLAVTDGRAAREFYGSVFGWEFTTASGRADCLLRGLPVAGLRTPADGHGWTVHLATDDCDETVTRVLAAGGEVIEAPHEVGDQRRAALVVDPTGARFGLWQGRAHPGCRLVNEPDTLVRNDLVTPNPGAARDFYAAVFDFTQDGNDDLPGMDFTFLRRPDGKEIGGIFGLATAPVSAWGTCFEVSDTDRTVALVRDAGGSSTDPEATPYGRSATITDPFGTEFSVIARP